MIFFYCGRLGHGTNECKEAFGDHSPIKHFGPWMKASPWKPMKVEDESDLPRDKGGKG